MQYFLSMYRFRDIKLFNIEQLAILGERLSYAVQGRYF